DTAAMTSMRHISSFPATSRSFNYRMRAMNGPQKSPLMRLLAVIGFLLIFGGAQAADEGNGAAGLVVYSDMNFIELEREFVGLQVVLVPYYDGAKSRLKM